LDTIDDYGDYAMLSYNLAEPKAMESVMNDFEDNMEMNILYYVESFVAGPACMQCCAYTIPTDGKMYKFNALAGKDGMVSTLYVHIFESLESMLEALKDDLNQHARHAVVVHSRVDMARLVADFM